MGYLNLVWRKTGEKRRHFFITDLHHLFYVSAKFICVRYFTNMSLMGGLITPAVMETLHFKEHLKEEIIILDFVLHFTSFLQ